MFNNIGNLLNMAKEVLQPLDVSSRDDGNLHIRLQHEEEATQMFEKALKEFECEFHPTVNKETGKVAVNIVSIHKNPKDEQECIAYMNKIMENYKVKFVFLMRETGGQIIFVTTW